tara:strand:- start:281 stop:616 length:336 start_codon:yes stop_codon:yes gene_type:complete
MSTIRTKGCGPQNLGAPKGIPMDPITGMIVGKVAGKVVDKVMDKGGSPFQGNAFGKAMQETGGDYEAAKAKLESGSPFKQQGPCWDDYMMVGTKMKNGKKVPNCVPKKKKK